MRGAAKCRLALIAVLIVCIALLVGSISVNAEAESIQTNQLTASDKTDGGEADIDFGELEEAVPDGVQDKLPEDIFEGKESFGEAVAKLTTPKAVVSFLLDALGVGAAEAAKLFVGLLGVLVLSAAISAFCLSFENESLSRAVKFCTSAAIVGVIGGTLYSHLCRAREFFDAIGSMMGGMLPITASIWAMGGNVTTASAGSATFGVMLGVLEWLWSASVIPVSCLLAVMGFCDAMCEDVRMGKLAGAIKKTYNLMLGITLTLLVSCLGAQTAISAARDSTLARTAKLVGATVIPVVGGGISETFRTLGTSVQYLKSVFGIGGIIFILLLSLPVLATLLLTRLALLISAGLADMLGAASEAKLLESMSDVYGCMLGVCSCSAAVFILSLCIFVQSVVAVL